MIMHSPTVTMKCFNYHVTTVKHIHRIQIKVDMYVATCDDDDDDNEIVFIVLLSCSFCCSLWVSF